MGPNGRARVRFGRTELEGNAGEPLLATIARHGWPDLVRSVRYHRPRGPFCGVGDCAGCLVRVNGVPNVRACRHRLRDGEQVVTENSWPSPRFDVAGALDLVFPHGIDSVHGLRRPSWAAPLYQRFARRLAGFGRPPTPAPPTAPPPARTLRADVTIVGAGRSGRAVAEALVRRGVRPLVLERRPVPLAPTTEGGPVAGTELLGSATAAILPAPATAEPAGGSGGLELLGFDGAGGGIRVRTRALVLATGSYDAGLVFEGSDRPGVVTADLAVAPLGLPFEEVVVVGGAERARQVVERLEENVVAVVAPAEISPELARAAVERDVPLYPRSRLVRGVGRGRLRAVELGRRDGSGRFRLACRSVVLAHRRLPNAQLAFQAGARRRWVDVPGAYFPVVDALGRSDVPGVYVVGSAARPSAEAAPTPERVAGAVLGDRDGGPAPAAVPPRPSEIVPYYRELLREPRRGKWVLCPCEDVLLDELERAAERGYHGLELAMRYTGVGTGLCQGRYCLPEAIAILAVLERRPPAEVGYVTQRPPLTPTPLGALASLERPEPSEPRP